MKKKTNNEIDTWIKKESMKEKNKTKRNYFFTFKNSRCIIKREKQKLKYASLSSEAVEC